MMQLMLGAIAVGLTAGPSSPALGESGAKKESFAAEAKSGGTAGVAVSVAKQTIREHSQSFFALENMIQLKMYSSAD
jgi:hypothetical protein